MSSSSAAARVPRDGVASAAAGDGERSADAVRCDAVVTPHRAMSDQATLPPAAFSAAREAGCPSRLAIRTAPPLRFT